MPSIRSFRGPGARRAPRALLALLVVGGLAGCASPLEKKDAAPPDAERLATVPDAVPQAEPRSKYGNPESYEVFGTRYYTLKTSEGFVERGIASWYGTKFHGRRTSSGEPYDMYAMTAAHKHLPLPTYAEVTNLKNGRSVVVKINDRGPFHGNRIIDLSYAAASKLGIAQAGTGFVEVRALTPSESRRPRLASVDATPERMQPVVPSYKPAPTLPAPARATPVAEALPAPMPSPVPTQEAPAALDTLYLQIGAFNDFENAARLRDRVRAAVRHSVDIAQGDADTAPRYRVQVGPIDNVETADELAQSLATIGIHEHWLTRR